MHCYPPLFAPESPVDVQIRPEDITLSAPQENALNGVVTSVVFYGVFYDIIVEAGGFNWLVQSNQVRKIGEQVSLHLDPTTIQIMGKPESKDEEVAQNV